ncbi:MAG: type II 3-dehydroquinate dehydratase, partial [Winogradskyella sp.]|nr:type II 3-dehydroquinate dehydratase [Winogradskyella sp.]
MKKFIIINGPNLNLLGKREPEIYGHQGFDSFLNELKAKFSNIQLDYFQSNIEGEI